MYIRIFFSGCLTAWLLILASGCLAQHQQGSFVNLGTQVTEAWIEGSTFATDSAGNPWLYTVLRGKPGYLAGVNLTTEKVEVYLPLDRMDGAWDINMSTDGWLYIAGSAGGRLARHRPGSQTIMDLGKPMERETYLFAIVPGKNGEMFGASYPGCRVFRYHEDNGFSDVGAGPIVQGENYVHGIAYHPGTDRVFAGIGSHSYLVELDPRTRAKRELLPAAYQGQAGFVYDMGIAKGLSDGDRLFANLPDLGKTFVYNLDKGAAEEELNGSIMVKSVIKSPRSDSVYYTHGDFLYRHLVNQKDGKRVALFKTQRAMAMTWSKEGKLYLLAFDGRILRYSPQTGVVEQLPVEMPRQPIGINITKLGPDGRIWTGGYLVGSNAAYDPVTGQSVEYRGIHQSESITVFKDLMYFGIYPGGKYYAFDSRKPWDVANENPKLIAAYKRQDRPFAGVNIDEKGTMLFGTVPDYGILGGALMLYHPASGKSELFEDVFPKQSVVSLINHRGAIFAGTSVWGGLGIEPTVKEAGLYEWDPKTKKTLFHTIPVADAKAITCLINGPDGHIWGVADGELFIFDPVRKKVLSRHVIYKVSAEAKKKAVWRDVNMIIHPSGLVYGTGSGQLFSIHPATKEVKLIKAPTAAHFLSMDRKSRLYYRNGSDLWQFTPNNGSGNKGN